MIVAANFSYGQRLSFCNNKFGLVSMSLTFMLYPIYSSKKGLAQAKKNKHNTAFPPSPAFLYCAPIPFITPLSPVLFFFLHLLFGFHFSFSLPFFLSLLPPLNITLFSMQRGEAKQPPSPVSPPCRPIGPLAGAGATSVTGECYTSMQRIICLVCEAYWNGLCVAVWSVHLAGHHRGPCSSSCSLSFPIFGPSCLSHMIVSRRLVFC